MITFDRVGYTYPTTDVPVLQDVSLTIAEGDFVLVVGTSGSGKSTFLRCLNGLVPHFYGGQFGGRVEVAGYDTRTHEPRELANVVGFVFQDPEAQMVVEVVEDELVFGMENLGIEPRIMRRRVEEVLDQLEIAHLRRRRVATLSGGERQRVAIAAVLAMQPQVLVLDEPTSQLDPHTAEEVLTALQKLNADLGLTVVLSEHRLERVVQYADQVLAFERSAGASATVTLGPPRDMLIRTQLAPPLAQLGRALGWQPLPLTVKEGRKFVVAHGLDQPQRAAPVRESQASASTPALHIEQITVRRANHDIVQRVSLDLQGGSIMALMGRNGSGKTTLLRTIMGLIEPTHGAVYLNKRDITRLPTEARADQIGYVPQDPRTLLFKETVADELRWTLQQRHRQLDSTNREALVQQTLVRLNLQSVAAAHPREISGGEQQRAALAAILVGAPLVLLLDEPTRGLDYRNKADLAALLSALKVAGHAIMLVTHDVELVATCADRIVLLGNGEVVVTGTPRELLNSSLIFSSQIGKLFKRQLWLTVDEALAGLAARPVG